MKSVEQMLNECNMVTGENQRRHDILFYRSMGAVTNVAESNLRAFAALVMEECAAMCDARLYNLQPGERPADAIRAAAKDLK